MIFVDYFQMVNKQASYLIVKDLQENTLKIPRK